MAEYISSSLSTYRNSRLHLSLHTLIYILVSSTLITKCYSCDPSVFHLARQLTRDLDVKQIPVYAQDEPRAAVENVSKIFRNGSIITLANGNWSQVDALVVNGDEITYTGSIEGAQAAAGAGAEVQNLNGRCLLPGFVEPHLHLLLTSLADNYLLKMSPLVVSTVDQAKAVIQDAISNGKVLEGGWIAGYGYDPSRVVNHTDLTVDVLDSISQNHSIYILNQSGHVAYANSKALAAAGVTAASVAGDPNFQQINGKLTGVLFEQATSVVGKNVPSPKPADIVQYCVSTLRKWMSLGCTTVFDAGIGSVAQTDIALYSAIPQTPLRFYAAISSLTLQNFLPVVKQPPFKLGLAEVTSIKFWADGSTQGFTAAVTEPYISPAGTQNHGIRNYVNASVLQAAMDPFLKAGFQLVVHSNGDDATDMVLDAYDAVFKANPDRNLNVVHRMEHFTVTRSEQLTRAKALGLGVSHTIGHVNYWGHTFVDYVLGEQRAHHIVRLREDLEAGLLWSLHSDSPVTDVHPLLYLKTATTRMLYPDGTGVLGDTEQVDLLPALLAITISPATQIGVDHMVGTLEVGKKADLVVLDRNIRDVPRTELDQLKVMETWIGGRKMGTS